MTTEMLGAELQKIDVVRERTGQNFIDARELLEANDWDVMEALIAYEHHTTTKIWEVKGLQVVNKVQQLIRQGSVTNIRIKANNRVVMEFPVTMGLVGTIFAPKLTLLAGITCLLSKCTIEFEQL